MHIPTILALFIATASCVTSTNVPPDNNYASSQVDTEFLRQLAPRESKGGGGKQQDSGGGESTFSNWSPVAGSTLTGSSNILRVEIHDPSGIKQVFIEVSFQNGAYSSYRANASAGQGGYYERALSNMPPGAYSWRVRAKNNNRVEATSDSVSFAIGEGKRIFSVLLLLLLL
jgi:hypothetical protein